VNRLLLDQDVFERTARLLISLGHDVVRVAELGMQSASDEDNLTRAFELNRIFITRDRDFGNLVFVRGIRTGVIYLRITPRNADRVHTELERVLSTYSEDRLKSGFIVIDGGRHRFRHI
jgi:predicted nuclease of predicted toxin-antitoxin system